MSIINFSDYLARRKAQNSNKPASFLEDQRYGTEKYDEETPFTHIPEADAGELIDDTDYELSTDKDTERDLRHKALSLAKEIYDEVSVLAEKYNINDTDSFKQVSYLDWEHFL